MPIIKEGSVRVDLLGGTLDLEPINLILGSTITLNLAASLKAKVILEETDSDIIIIDSKDYDKIVTINSSELTFDHIYINNKFEELTLTLQLMSHFNIKGGIKLTLSSGAPAGSGLGGSSAMAVTIFKALLDYKNLKYDQREILTIVKNIEARILNCGQTGYQDYYPALYGGILALMATDRGVEVDQLYSERLCSHLKKKNSLIFSGKSRLSGINNWEVYKSFFNGDNHVINGLKKICQLSGDAYKAIKKGDFDQLNIAMVAEGKVRESLFTHILTEEMKDFAKALAKLDSDSGLKVCGAGGGGCFLAIHPNLDYSQVDKLIKEFSMKRLDFDIERPIGQ